MFDTFDPWFHFKSPRRRLGVETLAGKFCSHTCTALALALGLLLSFSEIFFV